MTRYMVVERTERDKTQYGIAAACDGAGFDRLDDIVPTMEEAVRLAALLSQNGVAFEHFRDVVEDQVAERASVL